MHIGLVLVFRIALGIALAVWLHLRTVPEGFGRHRRRRTRRQAVAVSDWSRSLPGVRAR